jgi:thymidylate synthase
MSDERARSGSIPVLTARGRSLAEAWENSLLALAREGAEVRTEYDAKDAGGAWLDPPSLDCTMVMVVEDPSSEPLIHRAFPGGLEDLEEYRQEVMDGIKDHWVRDPDDPADSRWEYTYHERLTDYRTPGVARGAGVDQLDLAARKLAESPHSRRAQAVTWQPWRDPGCDDPPCLQSMWFRVLEDAEGRPTLNMNVRFRSRDAFDAAFMNCFAFVHVMEAMASRIGRLSGREVMLGRYVDMSDSYHVYGRRRAAFEDGFLRLVESRPFEDRTWTREFAASFFEEARPAIAKKVSEKDASDRRRDG